MFDKILIANRGEIACRIVRTCRRLGIRTVAVYSEADADALHVRLADHAVVLGPPPASESYLRIDKIVEAARASGAQAVHPGYGFLSENPALAEALDAAGIAFVGPPAAAIRLMGDKIEAKRLATEAGVSTVPGHLEAIADVARAARIAAEIGYPVMVKAAAGGGGKGMRIARDEGELREGLKRARSEARSSFGDDRVFLERFIEQPRHIEIQVLGDRHGHIVHLGERECSIQRRHQKVIEEAPSSVLDARTRRAMGEQAVALARAVGYHSAGTVEFIVDPERSFYFLEMNTRLQVEHPVTELVTGLDLVEQMIRIAAGEPLGFAQDDVRLDGWAIEARVYAEDPARGFLPSTGRIRRYLEPAGEGIRVDSGVVEGGEVSLFYDPMIAKLCAHAQDRAGAMERLGTALDGFYIRGPGHNAAFLSALVRHPRFRAGALSTDFIAAEFGERFEGVTPSASARDALAAIAVGLRRAQAERDARISGRLPGWRPAPPAEWVVRLGLEDVLVRVEPGSGGTLALRIEEAALTLRLDWRPGCPLARARLSISRDQPAPPPGHPQGTIALGGREGERAGAGSTQVEHALDDRELVVQVDPCPEGYLLRHGGIEVQALVRTREAAEFAARIPPKVPADTSKLLLSPMPGLIVSIGVQTGEPVKAGQEVAVLEAMKMENVLRAERDGVVEEIRVEAGATVAADQVLIAFV